MTWLNLGLGESRQMITCSAGGSTKVKGFIAWFMATPLTNAQNWCLWFLFVFHPLPSSWLFWSFFFKMFLYFSCLIDLNIPNICYNLSAVQGALSIAVSYSLQDSIQETLGSSWEASLGLKCPLSASVALQTCLPGSAHHSNDTLSIR